jgi:hypothetical protein
VGLVKETTETQEEPILVLEDRIDYFGKIYSSKETTSGGDRK